MNSSASISVNSGGTRVGTRCGKSDVTGGDVTSERSLSGPLAQIDAAVTRAAIVATELAAIVRIQRRRARLTSGAAPTACEGSDTPLASAPRAASASDGCCSSAELIVRSTRVVLSDHGG